MTGFRAVTVPDTHDGPEHEIALYPGDLRVCVTHQHAEHCICGEWIVSEEGQEFAAIRAHQRTPEHVAYHQRTHERWCLFCRGDA